MKALKILAMRRSMAFGLLVLALRSSALSLAKVPGAEMPAEVRARGRGQPPRSFLAGMADRVQIALPHADVTVRPDQHAYDTVGDRPGIRARPVHKQRSAPLNLKTGLLEGREQEI